MTSIRDIRPLEWETNTTQLPTLLDLFHWRMQLKLLGDDLTMNAVLFCWTQLMG